MLKLSFRFILRFMLPLSVLLSGLSLGLWAQDSPAAGNEANSENTLNRLIEISAQLSNLNGKLQNELQDSRRNSRELQSMLEESRKELENLRQELLVLKQEAVTLQNSSTELLIKAENSQTELIALQETLRKAESSLTSLELSFAAYREAVENRMSSLEKEKRLWKWGCIAAGVLAAGFGAVMLSR